MKEKSNQVDLVLVMLTHTSHLEQMQKHSQWDSLINGNLIKTLQLEATTLRERLRKF